MLQGCDIEVDRITIPMSRVRYLKIKVLKSASGSGPALQLIAAETIVGRVILQIGIDTFFLNWKQWDLEQYRLL